MYKNAIWTAHYRDIFLLVNSISAEERFAHSPMGQFNKWLLSFNITVSIDFDWESIFIKLIVNLCTCMYVKYRICRLWACSSSLSFSHVCNKISSKNYLNRYVYRSLGSLKCSRFALCLDDTLIKMGKYINTLIQFIWLPNKNFAQKRFRDSGFNMPDKI